VLDQVSNSTNLRLDSILNLINDELQPPLRLVQSNPIDRVITVGPIAVQTLDSSDGHKRYHTSNVSTASDVLFTGGTVTFPSVNGNNITTTAGGFTLALSCGSNEYVKVIIYYVDGVLKFAQGTSNASKDAATLPAIPSTATTGGVFVAGYVVIHNSSGTIDTIDGNYIYQYNSRDPLMQDASATVKGIVNLTTQSFSGLKTFNDGIATDTIVEETLDAGVTIDGLLIKDGAVAGAGVPKGGEPGAVSSSTSGQAGTADSVSRSDHNHDLGVHDHNDAASGGLIIAATALQQGAVSITSQTFAGAKTFSDDTYFNGDVLANSGGIKTTAATLNIGNTASTATTTNLAYGATANATTKEVNIGPNGVSGSITNVNFGSAVSGSESNFVFKGNKSVLVPAGDTASRPGTPANGMIRYNTDNSVLEHYIGGSWKSVASEDFANAAAIRYSIVFG
jgi:hypothetical protein